MKTLNVALVLLVALMLFTGCNNYENIQNSEESNYDIGYNAGYNDGQEDAYNRGYEEGYKIGTESITSENSDECSADEQSYDEYYDNGYSVGYENALRDYTLLPEALNTLLHEGKLEHHLFDFLIDYYPKTSVIGEYFYQDGIIHRANCDLLNLSSMSIEFDCDTDYNNATLCEICLADVEQTDSEKSDDDFNTRWEEIEAHNNNIKTYVQNNYQAELFDTSNLYTSEIFEVYPKNKKYYCTYLDISDIIQENGIRYIVADAMEISANTTLKLRITEEQYREVIEHKEEEYFYSCAVVFNYSDIVTMQPVINTSLYSEVSADFEDFSSCNFDEYYKLTGNIIVGNVIEFIA